MLRALSEDFALFADENQRYPQSLEELGKWEKQEKRVPSVDESGHVSFGCVAEEEHFEYESTNRTYRLYSVGRDGHVGGLELVGDLDRDPRVTVHQATTLHEFFYESPPRDLLFFFFITVVSSSLAGVGYLYLSRQPELQGAWRIMKCAAVVTTLVTVGFAIVEGLSQIGCALSFWYLIPLGYALYLWYLIPLIIASTFMGGVLGGLAAIGYQMLIGRLGVRRFPTQTEVMAIVVLATSCALMSPFLVCLRQLMIHG